MGKPSAWVEKLHRKRLPGGIHFLGLLQHLTHGAKRPWTKRPASPFHSCTPQPPHGFDYSSVQVVVGCSTTAVQTCVTSLQSLSSRLAPRPFDEHSRLAWSDRISKRVWRIWAQSVLHRRFSLGMCSPALQLGHRSRQWDGCVLSRGDTPANGLLLSTQWNQNHSVTSTLHFYSHWHFPSHQAVPCGVVGSPVAPRGKRHDPNPGQPSPSAWPLLTWGHQGQECPLEEDAVSDGVREEAGTGVHRGSRQRAALAHWWCFIAVSFPVAI